MKKKKINEDERGKETKPRSEQRQMKKREDEEEKNKRR